MEMAAKVTLKDDIRALKERLMDYRERERDIDNQIERIENLDEKMRSLQSPELSGMPHAQNVINDRIGKMYAEKDELEHEIRDLIEFQSSEREWIKGILSHIKKADEKACIQIRYLDVESWGKVSLSLFGTNEDYQERRDSYIRRTTKLHGRALMDMAAYLREQQG